MRTQHYLLLFTGILFNAFWTIHSQCSELNSQEGNLTYSTERTHNNVCWKIKVPTNSFARLKIRSLNFGSLSCDALYLRIAINETNENYTFCGNDRNRNPVITFSDAVVIFLSRFYGGYQKISFVLSYTIQDLECASKDSFQCTNHSCIPRNQVCDGVENCENGDDEVGCERGVLTIEGVAEARLESIAWLKSKRTSLYDNIPRTVTALFLGGANFSGSDSEYELMATQIELKTVVALLKNPISNEQLSNFINALLVICHNPRHFYGHDLVQRLKDQVELSGNFTHPIAYLALCNANETWPTRATTDLSAILNSDSDYPFIKDIQAFAVMAVSCFNKTKHLNKIEHMSLLPFYQKAVKQLKGRQLSDGSFGNIHTTALITQALISSGQENSRDWKVNATVKYLIRKLNSSSVDFITHYLTLPVLNGKSLSDVANINCSSRPRKREDDDLVNEISDNLGPKIRVQYSLFVNDDKDVIHTISLKVPENYTAYEVMQLAEEEDPKYRFEWKSLSGKIYVYKIGKTMNDPEVGKFWLQYLGSTNSTEVFQHSTTSPEELILSNGDHLVMWYRKAFT